MIELLTQVVTLGIVATVCVTVVKVSHIFGMVWLNSRGMAMTGALDPKGNVVFEMRRSEGAVVNIDAVSHPVPYQEIDVARTTRPRQLPRLKDAPGTTSAARAARSAPASLKSPTGTKRRSNSRSAGRA